jgi:hypothetical protein
MLSVAVMRSLALLITLINLKVVNASEDKHTPSPMKAQCETALQDAKALEYKTLLNRWGRYDYSPLPNNEGLILKLKAGEYANGTRTLDILSEIPNFDLLFRKVWSLGYKKYEIINVGYKNFQHDSFVVNRAIVRHMNNHPNKNLIVLFDPARNYTAKIIRTYRTAIHGKVLQKYMERKDYLSPHDFNTLKELIHLSGNSDVFGLLAYDEDASAQKLVPAMIAKRLLLTAQITYYGDRHFFEPTLRGLMAAAHIPIANSEDKLPFEYRIKPTALPEFRAKFYKRFKAEETAEIIRTARFDQQLEDSRRVPDEVRDKFFLNLFKTAESRGMKHIVIGVDKATGRYFKQYGFELYDELEIKKIEPQLLAQMKEKIGDHEYLHFIDIGSEKYLETIERLTSSTFLVEQTIEEI